MSRAPGARALAVGLLALAASFAAERAALAREIEFPQLTGRVVDGAGLLSRKTEADLSRLLEGHENATTNQVVVVTLESLDGHPIEEYGYQLGRHWGIGQKGKDNGVLLIVAPSERKVRIEVGYGLEGVLTDAISSNIIQAVILPAFRRGGMERGTSAGAVAIVEALGGKYRMRERRSRRSTNSPAAALPFILIVVGVIVVRSLSGGGRSGLRRGGVFGPTIGGGRGWGGGGGGFGGGGGGFGGGGASGGW